jgi:hypothetical protein
MNAVEAQRVFYAERVPAQFNRVLEDEREAARHDAEAARRVEEMEAVRTAIVVQVDCGSSLARHAYDVERGVMRYVEQPGYAPFLVLGHALDDFEDLRRECGDSLLGFLGGLAGLHEDMRLTSGRVRGLRELQGSIALERTGPGGFVVFAAFGVAAPAPQPDATIRIGEAVYAGLRSGEIDPQDAFLDGRIEVEGDVELAVGMALVASAPD